MLDDRDEPLWLVFEASSLNYTNDSNAGRDKALSAIASKRDPGALLPTTLASPSSLKSVRRYAVAAPARVTSTKLTPYLSSRNAAISTQWSADVRGVSKAWSSGLPPCADLSGGWGSGRSGRASARDPNPHPNVTISRALVDDL